MVAYLHLITYSYVLRLLAHIQVAMTQHLCHWVDQSTIGLRGWQKMGILLMPSVSALNEDFNTVPQDNDIVMTPIASSNFLSLHKSINISKDKLFFIPYAPEGTLMKRWNLIQVDMDTSLPLRNDYGTSMIYFCIFFAKHRGDISRSNEFSRWLGLVLAK